MRKLRIDERRRFVPGLDGRMKILIVHLSPLCVVVHSILGALAHFALFAPRQFALVGVSSVLALVLRSPIR